MEELYSKWCFNEREKLKNTCLECLKEIIKIFEFKRNYIKCVEYSNMYLKYVKDNEEINEKLINNT